MIRFADYPAQDRSRLLFVWLRPGTRLTGFLAAWAFPGSYGASCLAFRHPSLVEHLPTCEKPSFTGPGQWSW